MSELERPSEFDEEIIENFQDEMLRIIDEGGSEDLKHIKVDDLGANEMRAFGLLKKLNDGGITMTMFRDRLSEYQNEVEEDESLMHYFAWLRNQAMRSLSKEQ